VIIWPDVNEEGPRIKLFCHCGLGQEGVSKAEDLGVNRLGWGWGYLTWARQNEAVVKVGGVARAGLQGGRRQVSHAK